MRSYKRDRFLYRMRWVCTRAHEHVHAHTHTRTRTHTHTPSFSANECPRAAFPSNAPWVKETELESTSAIATKSSASFVPCQNLLLGRMDVTRRISGEWWMRVYKVERMSPCRFCFCATNTHELVDREIVEGLRSCVRMYKRRVKATWRRGTR